LFEIPVLMNIETVVHPEKIIEYIEVPVLINVTPA